MNDEHNFWMVYGLHQGAPTVRHKTEESAINEARRLARNNPDVHFYVLAASHHVVKRDVDVTPIGLRAFVETGDDVPF